MPGRAHLRHHGCINLVGVGARAARLCKSTRLQRVGFDQRQMPGARAPTPRDTVRSPRGPHVPAWFAQSGSATGQIRFRCWQTSHMSRRSAGGNPVWVWKCRSHCHRSSSSRPVLVVQSHCWPLRIRSGPLRRRCAPLGTLLRNALPGSGSHSKTGLGAQANDDPTSASARHEARGVPRLYCRQEPPNVIRQACDDPPEHRPSRNALKSVISGSAG